MSNRYKGTRITPPVLPRITPLTTLTAVIPRLNGISLLRKDMIDMIMEFLKKSFFFILIGVAIIVFLLFNRHDTPDTDAKLTPVPDPIKEEAKAKDDETANGIVIVDVKGAIKKPGIYDVSPDARVHDVIELAGGFTKQADQTMVNLAQKVQDEMVITIPQTGDDADGLSETTGTVGQESKLKINQATQTEIETLPGIGPSKAQAIIDYREENGPFQTIDDLLQVSGIGEKTLENFQDAIQIP